jgi:DNA ligase-1
VDDILVQGIDLVHITTMIQLPTLYNLRSDGSIQFWRIEIDGDAYRSSYGVLDGEELASGWKQVSSQDRALLEAERKYTKKKEKGFCEDIESAGTISYIRPMLACTADPEKIQFPIYAQPKLDGVRALVSSKGIVSRRGKPLNAPHVLEALRDIISLGYIFDGELYSPGGFEATCSGARRHHADEVTAQVQFHCFDTISACTYEARRAWLESVIPEEMLVPTRLVHTPAELDAYVDENLSLGYEGTMLRPMMGHYEHKRSKHLLKLKPWLDFEAMILRVLEGEAGRAGTAGSVECAMPDGTLFRATIEGQFAFAKKLWESPPIGARATIKYRNLTAYGVPRHAVMVRLHQEV